MVFLAGPLSDGKLAGLLCRSQVLVAVATGELVCNVLLGAHPCYICDKIVPLGVPNDRDLPYQEQFVQDFRRCDSIKNALCFGKNIQENVNIHLAEQHAQAHTIVLS